MLHQQWTMGPFESPETQRPLGSEKEEKSLGSGTHNLDSWQWPSLLPMTATQQTERQARSCPSQVLTSHRHHGHILLTANKLRNRMVLFWLDGKRNKSLKICLNPHHYTPVTPDLQGLRAFPPTSALKFSCLLCLNHDCTPGKAGRPWISMVLAGATQCTIQCLVPSLVDELQACNRRRASCICLIQLCSSVTSAVCSVLQGCRPFLLMTSGRGQEWFRKKPGSQPYLSWHKKGGGEVWWIKQISLPPRLLLPRGNQA